MKKMKLILVIGALGGLAMAVNSKLNKDFGSNKGFESKLEKYKQKNTGAETVNDPETVNDSENNQSAFGKFMGRLADFFNFSVNEAGEAKTSSVYSKEKVRARRVYTREEQKAELVRNKDNIEYLLYDIQVLVKDKEIGNERRSAKRIYETWKENLRFREMHALEQKFKALSRECGITDQADGEAYAELVAKWTDFLELLGLKIDDSEQTVITRENRRLYRNGAEFPDNSECAVIARPWFLDGELYCAGKVMYNAPEEPAAEPEPAEAEPAAEPEHEPEPAEAESAAEPEYESESDAERGADE